MKKYWANNTLKTITIVVFWWLFVAGVISFTNKYLPFTPTFPYYNQDLAALYSRFWSTFAHFDGIHYLRIASSQYPDGGEVAFFPFYPFLIHGLINAGMDRLAAGIVISNVSLFLSLLIFLHIYPASKWKLPLILLTFPMSFFFATVYTESLYLLVFALMLFFLKERRYVFAALAIGVGTATRFVGIGMVAYLILATLGKITLKKFTLLIGLAMTGLLSYMGYLWQTRGDPLAFIHVQPQFGMGRSGGEIIFLPQVLFRYAKMVVLADPHSIVYWRAAIELLLFILVSYVLFRLWHKLSASERIYSITVLLIPTLSGTLSSYPRYVLAAIPLFAGVAACLSTKQALVLAVIQICLLMGALMLFTRGLFVA